MHFTNEIDIPQALLDAQSKNKLVIFVGAGISKPFPSNLPDFEKLCACAEEKFLERRNENQGTKGKEPIDRFLGRLSLQKKPIFDFIYNTFSDNSSKPTIMHEHIVKLFLDTNSIRIVTTNFDMHFSTVLNKLNINTELFSAPALPPGDRFSGLVCLHGWIKGNKNELVFTDAAFGRAYLTEGWASRFLYNLFCNFTVLFYGYSHNDPIVQYLARALPADSKRFAFSEKRDCETWNFLGITPIVYSGNNELFHNAVNDSIAGWVEYSRMELLDHEAYIKMITIDDPPSDIVSTDRLKGCLKDPSLIKIFTKYAANSKWLLWANENKLISQLFNQQIQLDQIEIEYSWWVAHNFVCKEPEILFNILQKENIIINDHFWNDIIRDLTYYMPRPDPNIIFKWVQILLLRVPKTTGKQDVLEYLLNACRFPEDISTVLCILDYLLEPVVEINQSFPFDNQDSFVEKSRFELNLRGNSYWLNEIWSKKGNLVINSSWREIELIARKHLFRAFKINHGVGVANNDYDIESWWRSTIDSSDQNPMLRSFNVLVDIERDVAKYLSKLETDEILALMNEWFASGVPLLRRLAVYGRNIETKIGPDDKIEWLIKNNLLYDSCFRNEVFATIKNNVSNNSNENIKLLIANILKGPGNEYYNDKQKAKDYQIYTLLNWVTRWNPDLTLPLEELTIIREKNPEFETEEHPDLNHYISSTSTITHLSPISSDEFKNNSPEKYMDTIISYDNDNWLEGPDRSGLLSELSNAVKDSFDWSINFAEFLSTREDSKRDVWDVILWAWSESELSLPQLMKIIGWAQNNIIKVVNNPSLPRIIRDRVKSKDIKIDEIEVYEKFASEYWLVIKTKSTQDINPDLLFGALNHPVGPLVEFWLYALSARQKISKENWKGLPIYYGDIFKDIINLDNNVGLYALVMLSGNIRFLSSICPVWLKVNLIPFFNWKLSEDKANAVWEGFLAWGQVPIPLFVEFRSLFVEAVNKLKEKQNQIDRLIEHVAWMAFADSDSIKLDSWFYEIVREIPESGREKLIQRIGYNLTYLSKEKIIETWNRWIRSLWNNRIDNIPVPFSKKELGYFINLIPKLRPILSEAIEVAQRSPDFDLEHTMIYFELKDEKFAVEFPHEILKLLLFLLSKSSTPFWHCRDVNDILATLLVAHTESDVKPLRKHLIRLGCS